MRLEMALTPSGANQTRDRAAVAVSRSRCTGQGTALLPCRASCMNDILCSMNSKMISGKGRMRLRIFGISVIWLVFAVVALAQHQPSIPPHGKLARLFNEKDLAGFDTLLEKHGINSDPDKVFQVEKGVLHISGQEFGG